MEVSIYDNSFSYINDPYFILVPPVISVNQSLPADTEVSTGATAEFECQFGTAHPKSCSDEHIFTYYQLTDNNSLTPVLQQTHRCVISEDVGILINNSRYELTISKLEDEEIFLKYRYTFYIHNVVMEDNGSVFSCHVTNIGQIQWQNEAQLSVYPSNQVIIDDSSARLGYVVLGIVVAVAVGIVAVAVGIVAVRIAGWLLCIRRKKGDGNGSEADQGKQFPCVCINIECNGKIIS